MKNLKSVITIAFVLSVLFGMSSCSRDEFAVVYVSNVPVYCEESDSSEVIGTMSSGQLYKINSNKFNGWQIIDYYGQPGYINTSHTRIVDENGDTIWLTIYLFKGLLIFIGIAVAIAAVVMLFSLIMSGIMVVLGILLSVAGFAVGLGAIAWPIGYFITGDADATIKFIIGGVVIGVIIGIVRAIKNPFGESLRGFQSTKDAYNYAANEQRKRDEEHERWRRNTYSIELDNGRRATKLLDGTIMCEDGTAYDDNGDGTYTKR